MEAFQRPGGWRGWREGAVEEEGSAALTGALYSTLLSSGLFQAGRKRRGVSEGFFFSFLFFFFFSFYVT